MAWKVGQVVGNEYTIERELPEGGFGITYLTFKKNGQKVVVKTLNDKVQQRPDFYINSLLPSKIDLFS